MPVLPGNSTTRSSRMRHPSLVIACIATSITLSGCGGSGGGSETASTQPLQCGSPQWNITTQSPFDNFTVENIGEDALAALQDESQSAYILATESNATTTEGSGIVVPFKSIDSTAGSVTSYIPTTQRIAYTGASMDLQLIAGDVTCDGPTVDVEPITRSVDPIRTVSSLIDNYRLLLEEKAELYGYSDLAELRSARNDFLAGITRPSTGELPLLLALDGYDDVTDELLATDLPSDDRVLFASVLEHIGYPEGVELRQLALSRFNNTEGIDVQTNLPGFTVDTATVQALSQTSGTYAISKGENRSGGTVQAQNSTCAAIRGESASIASAAKLSKLMRRRNELAESLSGLSGGARDTLLAATPVIGVASGGAAAAIGGLVYVEKTITQIDVGTLPSELKSLTYELSPGEKIPEDYEQAGEQANWNNAKVTAASEGFNLTGPALDGISQVIGVGRWTKGLTANKGVVGSIQGFQGDLIQNEVFNALKNISGDAECLQIPAQSWADIDVTDRQWTTTDITQGQSLTLSDAGNNDRNLNLQELGVSGLEVEVIPSKFGGETIRQPSFIDVVPLRIIPKPGYLRITDLGTIKNLTVTLADSQKPKEPLSASKVSGGGSVDSQPSWEGITTGHQFSVTTPLKQEGYPMVVEVSRTSPLTGDVRTAQITLGTEEDITLTPSSACLDSGETQTFTATVEGADANTALNWTVNAGSLNEQGFTIPTEEAIYTPPAGSGSATVQVALASDSSVSDSADITYGQCTSELGMYGKYNARAQVPENIDNYEGLVTDSFTTGPLLPDEPELPSIFWLDRTDQDSSFLTRQDTASATINSSVLYESSTDGTATFELDMTGTTTCNQRVLDDGSLGDVECGRVGADADWSANYYIEITGPVTYQFDFEMQCSQTGKGWVQAFMLPTIFRYVGGDKDNAIPPNGYPGGPVEPTSGNFINTDVDSSIPSSQTTDPAVTGPLNVCRDTLSPVTVSKTMEFEGPANPGTPDIIVLSIFLEDALVGTDNYDVQSTLRDFAVGPILESGDPPVGTNDGSASIRIQMKMSEQSP